MDASCPKVLASLAVTIMAPGVKSGATFRICVMEMTMSAALRGRLPGLEIATLIFLIRGAPRAEAAQRAGKIHTAANSFLCIRFRLSPVVAKLPQEIQLTECSLPCTA